MSAFSECQHPRPALDTRVPVVCALIDQSIVKVPVPVQVPKPVLVPAQVQKKYKVINHNKKSNFKNVTNIYNYKTHSINPSRNSKHFIQLKKSTA